MKLDRSAQLAAEFARTSAELRFSSRTFSDLAEGCAEDAEILEIASHAAAGQPAAIFFLCVAQFVSVRHRECESLWRFSLEHPGGPAAGTKWRMFQDLCHGRGDEIRELLSCRTLNTSLVERATYIFPALRAAALAINEEFDLVELGCGAGLNLVFDKYGYAYGDIPVQGDPDSPLQLRCTLISGAVPLEPKFPRIVERTGIDLVPVDATSEWDRTWLACMTFPEWREERANLSTALDLRASHALRQVTAHFLEALPDILSRGERPVVLLHSHTLCQADERERNELESLLLASSRRRPVHRIGIEVEQGPGDEPAKRLASLSRAGWALTAKSMPSAVAHWRYRSGEAEHQFLGYADGFGRWLDWRMPARPADRNGNGGLPLSERDAPA